MAVNATVNASINATQNITYLDSFMQSFIENIIPRFLELVTAPYHHAELLWITIPLFVALVFMDIYFGRYKKEELGWNTAVGNTLALVFVAMDLFRQVWERLAEPSFWSLFIGHFRDTLVILVLALGSLWLFIANFFHVLPKKLAFLISSSLPTTVFAYLGIVIIYTDIPLDKVSFLAALVLFLVLTVTLKLVQFFIPWYVPQKDIEQMLEKKKKKK